MGNDDYMTDEEEGICLASTIAVESFARTKAVRSLLSLSGYEFGNTDSQSKAAEMREYYLHGIPVKKMAFWLPIYPQRNSS